MKTLKYLRSVILASVFVSCALITSCATNPSASNGHTQQRLDTYVNSANMHIAEMFPNNSTAYSGVQPALTQREMDMLDALADRIAPEVALEFDRKYTAWLNCWMPVDSIPEQNPDMRQLLKCNGQEFQELLEFCRQQDDDIFLLIYQLAARATCPFDQLLLHPAYDLMNNFPDIDRSRREVDLSLQNEKPVPNTRVCNEETIWYTRKILESRYRYPHTGTRTKWTGL